MDPNRSALRVFALADVPSEPWRNGQGVTRTLAWGGCATPSVVSAHHTGTRAADLAALAGAGPKAADSRADTWQWRVSVASITQDGPFSCFDGVDRISLLIAGQALSLQDASGKPVLHLGLHQSAGYPGETALWARCHGAPLQCLNVMTRRAQARAHLRLVSERTALAGECVALVLQGAFCAHFGPAQEFMENMPAGHVLQALPATNIIVSARQPESLLALVELFCG